MELSFTPINNLRLANLCGSLDENLRRIESTCEVAITRRGGDFTLAGAPGIALATVKGKGPDGYREALDVLQAELAG